MTMPTLLVHRIICAQNESLYKQSQDFFLFLFANLTLLFKAYLVSFSSIHGSNESFLQLKVHCWCLSTRNGFSTTSIIRISINWDFTATENHQDAKFNSFLSGSHFRLQNLLLFFQRCWGRKIFVKLTATAEEAALKKWASLNWSEVLLN